jgi:MerR family transcriptional regulator, mercuric resistance operon regulatory protein
MAKPGFTIGRFASTTGCSADTIRYYERIGLLAKPARSGGGHRLYDASHVRDLIFVMRCRNLGFPLDKVRQLKAMSGDTRYSCDDIRSFAAQHLIDIRSKLKQLQELQDTLIALTGYCEGGSTSSCGLLKRLQAVDRAEPR